MSRSDKLQNLAAGILTIWAVVGCLLLGDWLARGKQQPQHWYCKNTYSPNHDVLSPPTTEEGKACKAANERNHELCQQWRAAEAAEESAHVAWLQLMIGLFGLGGLLGTIIYTASAALAAARSAEVAERGLVDLERPEVFVDVSKVGVLLATGGAFTTVGTPQFTYRFRNYGRTPARLVDITSRFTIDRIGQNPAPITAQTPVDRSFPIGIVVADRAPYEERENLRAHYGFGATFDAPNAAHQYRLNFVGRFRYSDIFGATYVCGFRFLFDPIYNRWVQYGDNRRYNNARKES